ncbi:hypothetical protein N9933_01120 [bacterium]|nr:hypothetical protein [bacterium]
MEKYIKTVTRAYLDNELKHGVTGFCVLGILLPEIPWYRVVQPWLDSPFIENTLIPEMHLHRFPKETIEGAKKDMKIAKKAIEDLGLTQEQLVQLERRFEGRRDCSNYRTTLNIMTDPTCEKGFEAVIEYLLEISKTKKKEEKLCLV